VQELVVGVEQVPVPLQVAFGVSVEPAQVAPTQVVPEGYFWQAPLPLQRPLVPQVEAVWVAHWVAGTGARPPAIEVQVPTDPVTLQAVQVPVQALLQQKPLTQNPEAQRLAVAQAVPVGKPPQLIVVRLQLAGDVQSVFAAQVVLQVPFVLQANGSHTVEVTVLQFPAPSQVRTGVNVSPVQVAATQVVPLL
jgi:hypothetical protein